MGTIIETLAERVYAHGHAIGYTEAKTLGLPVEPASAELDELMWKLLGHYEYDMKLLEPLDPVTAVGTSDTHTEDAVIAMIESTWAAHKHFGTIEVRARRQQPPNLNVALNPNLNLPPNLNPQNQAALQQALQAAQQQIIQQAQQAVQQALKDQAPLVGVEAAFRLSRRCSARVSAGSGRPRSSSRRLRNRSRS